MLVNDLKCLQIINIDLTKANKLRCVSIIPQQKQS
ncbi:MAG: hypothetical protein ACI9V1_001332 [Spirosomataceae bacterium]|jgi:hypothetical protein